jgi:hypothetical protein
MNVGVCPRILLLESISTTLCASGAPFMKTIVTLPGWADSLLWVNMSMPEGFAVMLSVALADELVVGALVDVVVAGELVVVAIGGLAAVDVDFELELPQATIASAHTGTVSSVGSFLIALLSGVEGSDVFRRA